MNTILGGSFSSRLNLNLRERNGYTYGASSGFDMRASAGPFVAAAGVQTDKTSEALTEFFNELNGILKTVPADELRRAKNYVSLRYPSEFETTVDISRRLEDAIVYRLPDDYFAKYVPNIEAVTAADVQRVAQKYVTPDSLRGRHHGGPEGDRAGDSSAEARADQGDDGRRGVRPGAGALNNGQSIAVVWRQVRSSADLRRFSPPTRSATRRAWARMRSARFERSPATAR